jgi:S-DNA-T family DNA segregation ATPase FtsK/SpoIIIE
LLLIAVALYLILILYGYDRNDPAWSHSASGAVFAQSGRRVRRVAGGCAAVRVRFFAWWWAAFLVQRVWAGYRGISPDSLFDRRTLWLALPGFAVLLLSSSALEALRLYSLKVTLPFAPGGMLGKVLGDALAHLLGFTGATLCLLALMAASFSLFSGLSWLRFTDWLGTFIEVSYFWTRNTWQTWQDRRIGTHALAEREVVVEVEKKRVEDHQPIYIEPPVMEVPQSKRVEAEKQVPLFADMPDSPLPPLHLLDQPTA